MHYSPKRKCHIFIILLQVIYTGIISEKYQQIEWLELDQNIKSLYKHYHTQEDNHLQQQNGKIMQYSRTNLSQSSQMGRDIWQQAIQKQGGI